MATNLDELKRHYRQMWLIRRFEEESRARLRLRRERSAASCTCTSVRESIAVGASDATHPRGLT